MQRASPHREAGSAHRPRRPGAGTAWILGAGLLIALQVLGGVVLLADGWHSPPFVNSPLEYWRRNRDALGFPSSGHDDGKPRDPGRKAPEIEDLGKAEKQYEALLKAFQEEPDAQKKKALYDELSLLNEAIQKYKDDAQPQKRNPDYRKRAFIHKVICGLAYTNSDNLTLTEFGWLLENRERVMNELLRILREIGPEAVPQVWEHLRKEIVLHGKGKTLRGEGKEETKQLARQMEDLKEKMKGAKDRATWEALNSHYKKLEAELAESQKLTSGQTREGPPEDLGAPLDGLRNSGFKKLGVATYLPKLRDGGTLSDVTGALFVSKEFIDFLSRALLAIGTEGLPYWQQGLWDPNPAVREHCRKMVKELGAPAVPPLLGQLEQAKERNIRQGVVGALEELSGQQLGEKLEAWRQWWEKNQPIDLEALKKQPAAGGPEGDPHKIPEAPPLPPGGVQRPLDPQQGKEGDHPPSRQTPRADPAQGGKKTERPADDFEIGPKE